MAQPTSEITLQVDATGKDVKEKATEKDGSTDEGAGAKSAEDSTTLDGSDAVETSARPDTTTDAQSSAPSSRPSLVPLGSTHGQSSLSTPVAPHPKRFSAVNINKKFLEKNTVTGSSTTTSSTSSIMKVGNPAARSAIQSTSSHSKLVTAKLTAGPAVSSTPAGWSRSPSVAPSPAPATNSPSSTSPLPSIPATQASTTTSQPPHIIKAMQQQLRAAATQLNSSKESAAKPVWGNVKPPTVVPLRSEIQSDDFPTAAEVASVTTTRKQTKPDDVKLTPKPPSKQLRSEEADTFRGVHLDPNAHHWDEMEEDDDNFLDGVIEFGDGRQYTVNTSDLPQPADSSDTQRVPSQGDNKLEPSDPVRKEERFVDDFDRSWPRSKGSPASSSKEFSSNNVRSASPKPLPGHSPREYPRALFNERSNRLEPYNYSSHRQVQGPFGQRRPSVNEGNASDSLRGSRDGSHNIQVLRKGTGGDHSRSRRFSASSGGYPPASNGFVGAHREGRRDAPPTSPHLSRDQPLLEGPFNDKTRRSSMGPPPLPTTTSQRGNNRQLPPHLSPQGAPRRLSSRDSQLLSPVDAPLSPSFTSAFSGPPQSPAISHASLSPHKTPYASLPGNAIDLEEIRKDVMHNAAERAKARRQVEEEEREAQKERARRKAAEIEERIKTEKTNQNESEEAPQLPPEVNTVLEAAVELVESQSSLKFQDDTSTPSHPPRRPSIPSRASITAPLSTPQVESWRARPNVPSSPKQIQSRPPVSDLFSASGPSAVEHVASIADTASDLEVVDFTEMGRFVGVSEPSETHPEVAQASKTVAVPPRTPRPSASDFFEDSSSQPDLVSTAKSADFGVWRKKVEVSNEAENEAVPTSRDESSFETSAVPEESTTKEPLSHLVTHGQTVHVPTHHASPRPALRPQFKEAPMSALDDTMSRIKGVLVGMHAYDTPVMSLGQDSQSKKMTYPTSHAPLRQTTGRWVPPAIRVRDYGDSPESQEMFPFTILDRPSTPPPEITVQLPTLSKPLEVIHKRQLLAFNRPPPPARLDILTFEPPLADMKRTWLLNDVLFRGTFKLKYRVVIPKHRGLRAGNTAKLNIVGAFGRPNIADGLASWRKPVQPLSPLLKHDEPVLETGLDTMTRSPPPEGKASLNAIASIPKASETASSKSDNNPPVRTRQPKMPEGSAVAFMRDSRIDFVEGSPRPLVNFIVGSELEDAWSLTPTLAEPGVTTTSRVVHSPMVPKVELKHEPSKPLSNGSLLPPPGSSKEHIPPSMVDGQTSNDPVADGLATPPNHSPWAISPLSLPVKDSPSRAPDPEHLKAVWSQPSNKSDVRPVNSLKGIADDLTPLPFVLPDAKSSDGTTPSPSLPSAPSRMSIHEVTRAFQQVPTSAANQPSREKAQISPPTTNAPVARPAPVNPTATYPYPAPQNNMRAVYAHYPSPMMTHSPAPVIYGHMAPSPVQNRVVNGHPPMYNTWMPAQSPAPMMRSIPQSYPPMVQYASTGFNQPTGTNIMPLAPQTQGAGRPVGMTVMSPVLSPVQPHPYGGSPVLMHAPQNHGYLPMPPDRIQPLRTDNGHMPQHPLPSSSHSTHAGFNPGPSSPFTRPW